MNSNQWLTIWLGIITLFGVVMCQSAHSQEIQLPPNAITEKAVAEARGKLIWICDTPGGYARDGFAIGMDLWSRRAASWVPSDASCESAGAIAWLGGWHRSVDGRLLFHGMWPAVTQEMKFNQMRTYLAWQVPFDLAMKIVNLQPGELWRPSKQDLQRLSR